MVLSLNAIERLHRTFDVTATNADGSPATPDTVSVALVPPRATPAGTTLWSPVTYANGEATVLLAGPDADPTGALVVPADADLWVRVTVGDEVDVAKVERITVEGGGGPPAPIPTDSYATLSALTAGLAAKVDATDPRLSDSRAATDTSVASHVADQASNTAAALRTALTPRGAGAPELPGRVDIAAAKAPNAAAPLAIPTYVPVDDEVTHPAVVFVPEGWNGYRYWMAATPYTNSDPQYENPSIWASHDGLTWMVPTGLTNPVVPGIGTAGFNSDPDLVLGPDGTMYLFWRVAKDNDYDQLAVKSSTDGTTWSATTIIRDDQTPTRVIVSPGVVYDEANKVWHFWAVDITSATARKVVHATAPSPLGPLSAFADCTLPANPANPSRFAGTLRAQPWHLSATKVGDQYLLCLLYTLDSGKDGRGDLYLLGSQDGATFTRAAQPVLTCKPFAWDHTLYRPSVLPIQRGTGLGLGIWYSAMNNTSDWAIGYTEADLKPLADRKRQALLSAVSTLDGYTVGDRFNRADSATAVGTSDTGQPWTTSTGTAGINGGRFYSASATNTRAVINAGLADVRVGVDVAVPATTNPEWWLVVRHQDGSNFVRGGWTANDGGTFHLQAVRAGSAAVFTRSAPTPAPVAGDRLEFEIKGTIGRLLLNGATVVAVDNITDFPTVTTVGLQVFDGGIRLDNFTAQAAV